MSFWVVFFIKWTAVLFMEWVKLIQGHDLELWYSKILQVYGMCLRLFRVPKRCFYRISMRIATSTSSTKLYKANRSVQCHLWLENRVFLLLCGNCWFWTFYIFETWFQVLNFGVFTTPALAPKSILIGYWPKPTTTSYSGLIFLIFLFLPY